MTACPECGFDTGQPCDHCDLRHAREDANRERVRAEMDRTRPARDGDDEPEPCPPDWRPWWSWFGWSWFGAWWDYLGEVSARTGPDPVDAKQRCNCEQCQ